MKKISALLALTSLTACITSSPAEARRAKPAAPVFVLSGQTKAEEAGTICGTISKTGNNGRSSVVSLTTVDGSADAGTDYTAKTGTVTFQAADTKKYFCTDVINDTAAEPTESFQMKITAVSNGTSTSGSLAGMFITDTDVTLQTCWDGSVISVSLDCPEQPAPEDPGPGTGTEDVPSPTIEGEVPIPSSFDVNQHLTASWGTGAIAPSAAPYPAGDARNDVVGAFRFILDDRGLSYDDAIVYPGQPGASHLHQYYGKKCSASATYQSLRLDTTGAENPINGSCYWMPAMLDGKGNVVRPDYVAIYYKRRPISDPKCSLTSGDPKAEGNCVELPNGLKFIFGYDMLTSTAATGSTYFNCDGTGATQGHYPNIPAALAYCPVGAKIGAVINAPNCWDGVRLDSPNHRDHVSYGSYGSWGYYKCPPTHPYVIPNFTLQAWFSIRVGDDLSLWSLSSDAMHPTLPHGTTFHADFFMAWDPTVKKMWHDNCINKLLSCNGGDLGNGKQLKGFANPAYGWLNPTHLSAIP